jgi:hypothetical protein
MPHEIDNSGSLKKYIYSKQILDDYIAEHPREFKKTLHKRDVMETYF